MAKGKSNKSQVIRDYLEANPKAKPGEVVSALGAKGTKVSYNLVYTLKSKGKAKKRKQKRAAAVSAGLKSGMNDPASAVMRVRELASTMGGMRNLKSLVDLLVD